MIAFGSGPAVYGKGDTGAGPICSRDQMSLFLHVVGAEADADSESRLA
jgi:hypothetical protein